MESGRRFTFFEFFSETRGDSLKSPMVNLVRLTEIYKNAREHFSRISNRFAGKVRKPIGNGSPRKNLESERRFTFFGFSRKRVKIR